MLAIAVAPPLSQPGASACVAPHDHYPFCDQTKPLDERVSDLISRIREEDVPNLLTARGHLGRQQSLPYIGVPSFYWGHNCMVSTSFKTCVNDRCKTTFPSGPSIAATFDRELIRGIGAAIGRELRAYFNVHARVPKRVSTRVPVGLSCWGPTIEVARDPRWGRMGESGAECPYLLGELAAAWTRGMQGRNSYSSS